MSYLSYVLYKKIIQNVFINSEDVSKNFKIKIQNVKRINISKLPQINKTKKALDQPSGDQIINFLHISGFQKCFLFLRVLFGKKDCFKVIKNFHLILNLEKCLLLLL